MNYYKTIVILLFLLFIIILGVSPLFSAIFNKPVPVSAVRSYSMKPALTRGDLVVIWPTGSSYNYKVGQVVVFQSKEHGITDWTMHRIVGGDAQNGYITQGDANWHIDQEAQYPPIQPAWIAGISPSIGSYALKIPYLGFVVLFFSETLKKPFLLSALLLLLALFILWKPRNNG